MEETSRRIDETRRRAEETLERTLRLRAEILGPRCEECGRDWTEPRERWRAYRKSGTGALVRAVHRGGEALLYCPACCSELEFD